MIMMNYYQGFCLLLLCVVVSTADATVGSNTNDVVIEHNNNNNDNYYKNEIVYLPGHTIKERIYSPLPHTYLTQKEDLPSSFRWDRIPISSGTNNNNSDGNTIKTVSYITRSLNQHLPQWCGSCWAHGALSSFAE